MSEVVLHSGRDVGILLIIRVLINTTSALMGPYRGAERNDRASSIKSARQRFD